MTRAPRFPRTGPRIFVIRFVSFFIKGKTTDL